MPAWTAGRAATDSDSITTDGGQTTEPSTRANRNSIHPTRKQARKAPRTCWWMAGNSTRTMKCVKPKPSCMAISSSATGTCAMPAARIHTASGTAKLR